MRSDQRKPRLLRAALPWLLTSLLLGIPSPPSNAATSDLATVNGIPIPQEAFDRLARPYFEEVEARLNRKLAPEEVRMLERNVLEELIRERLWVSDARRRGFAIEEDSIDARIKRNPVFRNNGRIDEAKFRAYKLSPSSNYRLVRPQIESALLIERYAKWMASRDAPRDAELRRIYRERTDQARLRYAWLTPEAMSLDRTATAGEIRAYYDAHPDEFLTPDSARVSYVRIPFTAPPGAADSVGVEGERAAEAKALELLRQLARGGSIASLAKPHGGVTESGWFRLGDPVRGLGRGEPLTEAIRGGEVGAWLTNPVRVGPNWVVLRVEERRPPRVRSLLDVAALAKQRADAAARDAEVESLAASVYRENPAVHRVPRVIAAGVARDVGAFGEDRPISERDIRKALERLRERAGGDTAAAWSDSVLADLPARIRRERAEASSWKAFRDAAERLRRGESVEAVAARMGGRAFTVSRYRGEPPPAPALVEGSLLDSLYRSRRGAVVGPRVRRDSVFVIRIEEVDESHIPPFAAVRNAARTAALDRRRESLERESRRYFEEHRDQYMTPLRWRFDYVYFRKAVPESVPVPAESIAAYYAARPAEFTEPARMRARHILIAHRAADGPKAREAALARAREALRRARAGEAFGALARELSDDRNSAVRDGDLGEFTPGTMVKDFADAAFALEPGGLSDIVETSFGFHLIRAEEKRPQRLRSLEECRSEIQSVLGRDLADSLANRAATALASAAAAAPDRFESLAASHGGVVRSPPVGAGESLAGIGPVGGIERTIGDLAPGAVTPVPVVTGPGYLVARLAETLQPALAPWEEVRERVEVDLQMVRRQAVADSLTAWLRAALQSGQPLDSLALTLGGLRPTRLFPRSGPIAEFNRDPGLARDSTFLARIFASRPGTALPPQSGASGTVFAVVDTILVRPSADFAESRAALRQEILDEKAEAWTANLRARASIQIHRKDLAP